MLPPIQITIQDNHLTELSYSNHPPANGRDALTQDALHQLSAYFKNANHHFTLPLNPIGTPFQQRVWKALLEIPAGTTVTYADLAKKLKTSPRAVGNACRRNPIPIIIPCHRVVAKNHLGGYSGATSGELLDIKKWLLMHEGL